MKKMCIGVMVALIAVGLGSLTTSCAGQESDQNPVQPHFAGQAPGKRQVLFQKIEGSVSAVDTNAMTLKIVSGKETRAFKMTSKTKFTRHDGKPASLGDVEAGKTATVVIAKVYGQPDEVVSVRLHAKPPPRQISR